MVFSLFLGTDVVDSNRACVLGTAKCDMEAPPSEISLEN